jgi:hypothetical protein
MKVFSRMGLLAVAAAMAALAACMCTRVAAERKPSP